jgi:hypothetical protein
MAVARSVAPVIITPLNEQVIEIPIIGTAPLVIHRFDEKIKDEFRGQIIGGSSARSKKRHAPRTIEEILVKLVMNYGKVSMLVEYDVQ